MDPIGFYRFHQLHSHHPLFIYTHRRHRSRYFCLEQVEFTGLTLWTDFNVLNESFSKVVVTIALLFVVFLNNLLAGKQFLSVLDERLLEETMPMRQRK
ncbi:hypothetical protein G6F56_014443 [Rhizopus delemar]|nr:hypothetical protein G6F56_014443 [Rhizopus delemar]